MQSLVGVIMGSQSDWATMTHAAKTTPWAYPTKSALSPHTEHPTSSSNMHEQQRRAVWKS